MRFTFTTEGKNRIAVHDGITKLAIVPDIIAAAQNTAAAAVEITVTNVDYVDGMSRLHGLGFNAVGGNEIDGVRVTSLRRVFADRYVLPEKPPVSEVTQTSAIEPLVARSLAAYRENRKSTDAVKQHFVI